MRENPKTQHLPLAGMVPCCNELSIEIVLINPNMIITLIFQGIKKGINHAHSY